jgi:hypothetical protein
MNRAPTDPEKLAAAIQELEAERRRREDERVAAGTAIRVQLSVVVAPGEDEAEALARAKAGHTQPEGEKREVLFEDPIVVITGVPRAGRTPPDWKSEPNTADPAYRPPTPTPTVPAPEPAPAPVAEREPAPEWRAIKTQVTAPSEGGLGGVIAEGWYAIVDGELRIEDWRGRMFARPIAPGEDAAMLARKVLREKWASHDGGFNDPIRYPPRSIH